MPEKNFVLAAFDFDCTLTRRDMFHPFALYSRGLFPWILALLKCLPLLFKGRQKLKEQMIKELFPKWSLNDVDSLGKEFAENEIDRFIKPKARKTLEWHKSQGHTIAIVSAGLETYVRPWAEKEGIKHILASKLEVSSDGKITGNLQGLNCRGKEKVRRIIEHFGPKDNYELYAYGDSAGDKEMLAFADHSHFRKI